MPPNKLAKDTPVIDHITHCDKPNSVPKRTNTKVTLNANETKKRMAIQMAIRGRNLLMFTSLSLKLNRLLFSLYIVEDAIANTTFQIDPLL